LARPSQGVKINRIEYPHRLGYLFSHPPTELFLDHESIETDYLRFVTRYEGIEAAIVRQQTGGADTTTLKRSLMDVLLARRHEPHLKSGLQTRFK
jgi:hypothetical protein